MSNIEQQRCPLCGSPMNFRLGQWECSGCDYSVGAAAPKEPAIEDEQPSNEVGASTTVECAS